MSHLTHISTAEPRFAATTDDMLTAAKGWLDSSPEELALFSRFLLSSKIATRHFALPLEEIRSLNGTANRASRYLEEARLLGEQAVTTALAAASLRADEVDVLITTSCTMPIVPALDTHLINSLGLRNDIVRVPIYQYGCVGGAAGLSLASSLSQTGKRVLVLSVELCSLGFQSGDHRGSSLVGSAIFADGAACAVIAPPAAGERTPALGELKFLGSQSFVVPNSTHLMGYDLMDGGTHLRLDRELPSALAAHAPSRVKQFLESHGLVADDIAWWLFHPGGVKVLQSLEETFGLGAEQSRFSWNVLSQHGNMSSASILYVISDFINSKAARSGDKALVFGVGPGLTIELILLEQR